MSKDPTYSVAGTEPVRSVEFQNYRKQWDSRVAKFPWEPVPVHLDLETVATCDLKCGSSSLDPTGFCQIWTHEHLRTLDFDKHQYKRGMMKPKLFISLAEQAAELGILSVKVNYRGEPTLHPAIVDFVELLSSLGFVDIMMNTNGNGGARKDPELFVKLVKAGLTSLSFSVDACDPEGYVKQRVGGDWQTLLNSVRSAVLAKDMGFGSPDLRIRASAVRTKLNKDKIDSGELVQFWRDQGMDWVSISECYFPSGTGHTWLASQWEQVTPDEFQCSDPFRRLIVTWDGKHTLPCCQGFTMEIDGGDVSKGLDKVWNGPEFGDVRLVHIDKVWDSWHKSMCRDCALTKKVVGPK